MIGRRCAVVGALAAVLLLTACTQQGPSSTSGDSWREYRHPTTPVVSFSGPKLGGGTVSSSAYPGKVLVVNFWFASCGPCIAEAGTLDALQTKYGDQGAQFVGVNIRDQAADAQSFVDQYKVHYPVLLDQQNHDATQLDFAAARAPLTAPPMTVVVGKRGRVTGVVIGQADSVILSSLISAAVTGRDS